MAGSVYRKPGGLMTPKTLTKSLAQRRTGPEKFLMKVFIITLIPVTLAGATFLFLSLYLFLREASFLSLKNITIEGNHRISRDEVLALTGLNDAPNILGLNIRMLNRRLVSHPWIEKSMVKRIFPDGIRIVIDERQPIALIHLGKLYYVDKTGEIFDQATGRDKTAYPILTGLRREDVEEGEKKTYDLLQQALHLLQMTHKVKILPYASISQIHLDRAIGLLVYTTDRGTEFRMGFAGFEEKFQRLLKIWPVIKSMDLRSIDCTIPEKVFVQPVRSDKMKTRQHKTRRQQSK